MPVQAETEKRHTPLKNQQLRVTRDPLDHRPPFPPAQGGGPYFLPLARPAVSNRQNEWALARTKLYLLRPGRRVQRFFSPW